MEQLLTKADLAQRWQVSEKTIDEYRGKGIIKQVSKISSIRFNPQHIREIEETKLDRFSPLERKRLENEIEILKKENDFLKQITNNILSEALKVIPLKNM